MITPKTRAIPFAVLALTLTFIIAHAGTLAHAGETSSHSKASTARVADRTFSSKALGRTMKYRVLLPQGYERSARRYPVLYLLHGWNGGYQNWETLTNLELYAEPLPLIIVMPDSGNSWYVDSATVPEDRFEHYIVRDLVEEVDENFRTLRSAHHRAIAGLSMGGYGAVKIALKNPDIFAAALSLSGAFNAADRTSDAAEHLQPSLQAAFGPEASGTRQENDLFTIVEKVSPGKAPYLFISCGTSDEFFVPANRKLVSILSTRGFRYEYHEFPGRHNWVYWDQQLPSILQVASRAIQ